jgi:hypothetical protein
MCTCISPRTPPILQRWKLQFTDVQTRTAVGMQRNVHPWYQWRTQEFCSGGGGSTNSVEDRGHRERGSWGGSPLVRGSAQFAIRFDYVKLSGCRGLLLLLLLLFNCNWVDTRWQQYSTHLHTNSTQNTENGAHITIQKKKNWELNWEVTDVFSTELGIRLSFVKTSEFRGVGVKPPTTPPPQALGTPLRDTPICGKYWTVYRQTSVLVPGDKGRLESHLSSYRGTFASRAGKAHSFT